MSTVKQQIQQLAETLPEDVTWEQVSYEVHLRQQIEEGESAIAEGRTVESTTGAALLARYREHGSFFTDEELAAVEGVKREDRQPKDN